MLSDLLVAIRDAGAQLAQHGPSLTAALLEPGGTAQPVSPADPQPLSADDLKPVLERLLSLLRRSDMRAVDVLEELHALSAGRPRPALLTELEKAIDRLDFELAASLCMRLADDPGWP